MDVTVGRLARWGEALNPLVVKEVRQGLRSRLFWVSFGLLLLVCFLIALKAYVQTLEDGLTPQGEDFFLGFFFCLGLLHFVLLPYGAYRSLSREREDETWVLLILTGLGPRRILWGKVGSCLVQGGLYASALGPFLLFSYYLNGIDLPTLLEVLAFGVVWFVFLTMVAVCAATLAEGRMGRGLVHVGLLGVLGWGLFFGEATARVLCDNSLRSILDMPKARTFVTFCAWMTVSGGWLLFETAAARLAPLTENYSRGPRRALVVQTVLSALLLGAASHDLWASSYIVVSVGIFGGLYLLGCGIVLATDEEGQARSLRAATRAWSLLRPGALRGFRLAVLLLLFWSAARGALFVFTQNRFHEREMLGALAAGLDALLYLSLPLWVARLTRAAEFSAPVAVRLLFVLLGGLGLVLPSVGSHLIGDEGKGALMLLDPVRGMEYFDDVTSSPGRTSLAQAEQMFACLALLALLSVFLADRALAARERAVHAA